MIYKRIYIYNLIMLLFIFTACSSKSPKTSKSQNNPKLETSSVSYLNLKSSTSAKKISNTIESKSFKETKNTETTKESTKESTTVQTTKAIETSDTQTKSKKKNLEFINSYTTNFDSSKNDRIYNIKLASKKINGIIIESGEIFSFNNIVGAMGAKQGFKKAVTFVQGKEVEDYGGGICQVSTTIFNAVKSLGVEILEQHHHSHEVPYVKKGEDAAISYGSEDFKFKNLNSYPLQINIKVKKSSLSVSVSKVNYE